MATQYVHRLESALLDVAGSLAAAISLLENGSKKAAPSDKMFDIMLNDYRASLDHAREIWKEQDKFK